MLVKLTPDYNNYVLIMYFMSHCFALGVSPVCCVKVPGVTKAEKHLSFVEGFMFLKGYVPTDGSGELGVIQKIRFKFVDHFWPLTPPVCHSVLFPLLGIF